MNDNNLDIGATSMSPSAVCIQDVIRERKEERKLKAEERRQSDLQRIRDMRSSTGIDPIQLFPKEIWMMILDELSPEDRGNIWKLHPVFRDLMESTRLQNILLPQLFNLNQFQKSLQSFDMTRHGYNEILRTLCRTTRNYFDHCMSEDLLFRIRECETEKFNSNSHTVNLFFRNTEDRQELRMLLNSFVVGRGKRFFPRALGVFLSDEGMVDIDDISRRKLMNEFLHDLAAVLLIIGDDIWDFKFVIHEVESLNFSFLQVYNQFRILISLMPNLKSLGVLIDPAFQMIQEEINGKIQDEFSEAESFIRNHPFPHLSHLERLSLFSTYQRGTGRFYNIYVIIIEANQHINNLELNKDSGHSDPDLALLPEVLTQSLELTSFKACNHFKGNVSLVGIRPLINFNWKLGAIHLNLKAKQDDLISSIFSLLKQFPTLEKVKLTNMENFIVRDTDKIGYLILPNLKDFEMEMDKPRIYYDSNLHFFFSLQFLLHCKRLKRICWGLSSFDYLKLREHLKKKEVDSCREMMDFRGGMRYLYDSDIWQVFPELELLSVILLKDVGIGCCKHYYLRKDVECMSVRKFLKTHFCYRFNLHNGCVL